MINVAGANPPTKATISIGIQMTEEPRTLWCLNVTDIVSTDWRKHSSLYGDRVEMAMVPLDWKRTSINESTSGELPQTQM